MKTVYLLFQALLLDPSQIHRPEPIYDKYNEFHQLKPGIALENVGKDTEAFRDFNVDESMAHVRETYKNMHTKQTVALGKEMVRKIG